MASQVKLGARKITDHHNVPESMGGSDEDVNISRIDDVRHSDFHEWAWNHLPCQLTRLLILHALGTERPPTPDTLETVFQITTMKNSTKLYKPGAYRHVGEPSGLKRACKAAEYSASHARVELTELDKTFKALTNGGHYPIKTSVFLPKAMQYFKRLTTEGVVEAMYTETDEVGDLAWTKSMQDATRESIRSAVTLQSSRRSKDKQRRAYVNILRTQERILEEHFDHWKRALGKYAKYKFYDGE